MIPTIQWTWWCNSDELKLCLNLIKTGRETRETREKYRTNFFVCSRKWNMRTLFIGFISSLNTRSELMTSKPWSSRVSVFPLWEPLQIFKLISNFLDTINYNNPHMKKFDKERWSSSTVESARIEGVTLWTMACKPYLLYSLSIDVMYLNWFAFV